MLKPVPRQEGMDKAAKIKLGLAIAALILAPMFLCLWYFDISLFGGGQAAEAAKPLPPEVKQQQVKMLQEQKQRQDEQKAKSPNTVTAGS